MKILFFLYLAVMGLNTTGGGIPHTVNLIPCILFFTNVLSSS